ncbi:hypothetical protein KIW84_070586 [Lathyrus oleraceus]|uniref:RRM domain-containing protein n=1 Tax=Pisum sativum TaxID=3888 RepID=A0A9D4VGF5_PEA|nr:hypothetical protein KIW84_070586 [Pisum sativum]
MVLILLQPAPSPFHSPTVIPPRFSNLRKLNYLKMMKFWYWSFSEEIPIGLGVLNIQFAEILNDRMKGFYRSKYEHNSEKRNMAVTQFEPADARRCFPCWDEPACKATFKITLDVPSDLVALSNIPVAEEKLITISKLFHIKNHQSYHIPDGVKVRVYCQVGKANQGKFALDVAVKTLGLYKDYFDTPYTLPKLDVIAISDFAAGAMENYGLVTYRETALLYDDQHSAAANKKRVAIVVAHELAHQWFGNFVTMERWTHLWLNEGFATWASRSVHRTRPIKRNTLKLSNRDVPENNPSYTTVYVGNLPRDVTQAELHCQFHALGAGVLEEVRVQRDKGFGFVRYNTHEEAALATQMANGRPVRGKTMKCSWGSKPTPLGTASNPLPPPAAQPYQILPTAEMTVSTALKQKSSSIEGIENWPYEASACQIKIKKDHL